MAADGATKILHRDAVLLLEGANGDQFLYRKESGECIGLGKGFKLHFTPAGWAYVHDGSESKWRKVLDIFTVKAFSGESGKFLELPGQIVVQQSVRLQEYKTGVWAGKYEVAKYTIDLAGSWHTWVLKCFQEWEASPGDEVERIKAWKQTLIEAGLFVADPKPRMKKLPRHISPRNIKDLLPTHTGCLGFWDERNRRIRLYYPAPEHPRQSHSASIDKFKDARGAALEVLTWTWKQHKELTGQDCPFDLETKV